MPPYTGVEGLLNGSETLSAFVWPEEERPKVSHDEFRGGNELPVIDLDLARSQDPLGRKQIGEQMVQAGAEWGFFQILSPSFPPEMLNTLLTQARKYFDLPLEMKQKSTKGEKGQAVGYGARTPIWKGRNWLEVFHIIRDATRDFSSHKETSVLAFGEGPDFEEFSKCLEEYQLQVEKLAVEILKLLAEGMGKDPSTFLEKLQDGKFPEYSMRLNNYPPCPEPSSTLGLGAHKDPNLLTILLQDAVGGLQVKAQDGNWVTVRPRPDALVVNMGSMFELWSNGRFTSAEHRAVVNANEPRLSIACFIQLMNFHRDVKAVLYAPEAIIDEEHPRVFRSCTIGEYWGHILGGYQGATKGANLRGAEGFALEAPQ